MARAGGRGYDAGLREQMTEVIFTVGEMPDGGYVARALDHGIFTEADTLLALRDAVCDAVRCHFDAYDRPELIRLRCPREDVIATTAAWPRDDPFTCFAEWPSGADTSGYSALARPDDPSRD